MESIWTAETKIREREALPRDMEVDAVVIGAGMAGVLSAYYLHKEGVRTVVLEADRIGSGQTKNTTAKITSQHGLLYDRIIQTMGTRKAFAYAWANEEAIDEYERLILEKGIDCDLPGVRHTCIRVPRRIRCGGRLLRRQKPVSTLLLRRNASCLLRWPVRCALRSRRVLIR